LDLAVTIGSPPLISVFRNTSSIGAVAFSANIDYPLIDVPFGNAIGDLDGDGKPDLAPAILNSTPSYVSILKNSSILGNLSFVPTSNYAVGNNAFSDAIEDIDGDGKPDLITANASSNSISILENQLPLPLPLSLSNFEASIKDNQVELSWETTIELNSSYFNIERSLDAHKFTTIGTKNAENNPNGHTYDYLDEYPQKGLNFYRLKIVDLDGKYTYGPVIQVQLNDEQKTIILFPNPANSYVVIQHPVNTGEAKLEILDMVGRLIRMIEVKKGTLQTIITLSNLSRGSYQIVWIDNGKVLSQTLISK